MSLRSKIRRFWFELKDEDCRSLKKINKDRVNCKSIKDYAIHIFVLWLIGFVLGFVVGYSVMMSIL